jgi:hypothetical protein
VSPGHTAGVLCVCGASAGMLAGTGSHVCYATSLHDRCTAVCLWSIECDCCLQER